MPNATNIKQMTNAEIADMVRNQSSTLYQQRVPSATKNGIKATMAALEENRPLWNEFVPTLLNQIGKIIARNNSWTNELVYNLDLLPQELHHQFEVHLFLQ